MGKKPVIGMIGLVWAGIALTGCGESCRNCHNKYSATPTFQSRNTKTDGAAATPTMIGEAKPATTPDAGPSRLTDSKDPLTTPKAPVIEQTSGTSTGASGVVPASTPSLNKPTTQSSLRPTEPRTSSESLAPAPGTPKQLDDGFTSRVTSGGDSRSMTVPPRPVTTTTSLSNTATPSMQQAPPLQGKALPSMEPTPSAPPAPLPPPSANAGGMENGSPPPLPPGK